MKIAVTGCYGSVGRRVVMHGLDKGHTIIGIDHVPPLESDFNSNVSFSYHQIDLKDFEAALKTLQGSEAVIHLAGIPQPRDYLVNTHNSNVLLSWNVLRAAAELGITRVAQASSVNVIALFYSKEPKIHYFPIDEEHPCEPDEPYGLSKVICELQAATIVRRYPFMRVASLRLHWSVPNTARARRKEPVRSKGDLWGYVQEDSGAEAFYLALFGGEWQGHEAFFIVAPDIADNGDVETMRQEYYPDVPVKEGKNLSYVGFFDCSKAERLLGWVHRNYRG